MSGETTYKITVTLEEAIVIRSLLDTLADCPTELLLNGPLVECLEKAVEDEKEMRG